MRFINYSLKSQERINPSIMNTIVVSAGVSLEMQLIILEALCGTAPRGLHYSNNHENELYVPTIYNPIGHTKPPNEKCCYVTLISFRSARSNLG